MRQISSLRNILVAAAIGFSCPAWAQPPEIREPGDNGFKVGAGRLHLFLDVEGRYDSNVLFSTGHSIADMVLHLRPGFNLDVPGQMVNVALDAQVDWNKYLGIKSAETSFSQLFAEANLDLVANPAGRVNFELKDLFRRTDKTPSLSLATAVISDYNDLNVRVPIRPGGGALLLGLGGEWQLESFEPYGTGGACGASGPTACSQFSYNQVAGKGEARWLFLPRTALVLDLDYFARLPKDTAVARKISGLHAMTGLQGLVTPNIAATLKAGYGDTFGSAGTSYRTWLTNVEAEYIGSEVASLRIGYVHTYAADAGSQDLSLYGMHRVYAEGKILLAGRLSLHALGEWDRLGYVLGSVNGASAQVIQFTPTAEYEVMRWVRVAVGCTLTHRTAGVPLDTVPAFNYTRNEVWARLRLVY